MAKKYLSAALSKVPFFCMKAASENARFATEVSRMVSLAAYSQSEVIHWAGEQMKSLHIINKGIVAYGNRSNGAGGLQILFKDAHFGLEFVSKYARTTVVCRALTHVTVTLMGFNQVRC